MCNCVLTFFSQQADSTNVFSFLLPHNLDHVTIQLGGYIVQLVHKQLIAWEYAQTEQLQPLQCIIT